MGAFKIKAWNSKSSSWEDGSTDGTAHIVRDLGEPRLRYFRQERMEIAAARNRGVLVARGDLISFLDADDVWLANKLRRQIASLKQGERDMIFTQIEEFISPDRICILIYERFRASDWPISP